MFDAAASLICKDVLMQDVVDDRACGFPPLLIVTVPLTLVHSHVSLLGWQALPAVQNSLAPRPSTLHATPVLIA